MTPQDFFNARFAALQRRDYPAVYDTYHPDAPFRRQFSNAASYQQYAAGHLAQIAVEAWQYLDTRWLSVAEVECLLSLRVRASGTIAEFYELARLLKDGEQWRYHSAQKLSPDEVPAGTPVDFSLFDAALNPVRF